MKKRWRALVICAALCSFLYVVQGQQAGQSKESVARGRKLYLSYCASCHGVDGSGDGPVASALKERPPDLRRMQARRGKFPEEEVRKKIAGDETLFVHGRKEMPVWGLVLTAADIKHLVKYVASLQRTLDAQPAQ